MSDDGDGGATVSVCIPTYERPDLLILALESCLRQTEPPDEIVIGDDSRSDDTDVRIRRFLDEYSGRTAIRYLRNSPGLGQSANVTMLFRVARGRRIVLLHDDDLLLPVALESLSACFAEQDIDACFGKQYLMDQAGEIDVPASEELNRFYFRSAEYTGSVLSSLDVVLAQQFPNDAFMIDAELARRVGYPGPEAGDACDFVFALLLGRAGCRFFLIDRYLAAYRDTEISVSGAGGDASYVTFKTAQKQQYQPSGIDFRSLLLSRHVRQGILGALATHHRRDAVAMYVSRYHLRYIPTRGGMRRFIRLLTG